MEEHDHKALDYPPVLEYTFNSCQDHEKALPSGNLT